MATRLGDTFHGLDGEEWTINIHDSSYGGGIVPYNISTAVITGQTDSRDLHAPIFATVAKIGIEIDGATLESFVTDFVGAPERRFRLEIRKGADLFWVGLVLTDNIQKQDKEWPYIFNITATDGLGILKDIDYNDDGTAYSGKERVTEHIINCLNKIGTDDLFSTPLLSTACKWFSADHASTSIDPVHLARFDHRRFIKIDTNGVKTYTSCYEVLKQCAQAFGARLILTDGTFKLIQVNEFEGATFDLFNYTTGKVVTTATGSATYRKTDATNITRLDGGNFQYLPALNKVIVKYKHFQAQSVIPATGVGFTEVTYESIDSGGATSRLLLSFQGSVKASFNTPSDFKPLRLLLKLKVQVGTNYLKRTASINSTTGAYAYTDMTWESSESFFEVFTPLLTNNNISQVFAEGPIFTPAIPADGDLILRGRYFSAYTSTGASISPSTVTESFYNAYVEVIPLGIIEDRANQFTYTVENDTANNTATKEVNISIGDGPSVNALGALQVYNGSGWVESAGWKVNATDGTIEIGQLLAQELLLTRTDPRQIINASYKGTYTPLYSIYHSNKDHIPLTCSINIIEGKTQGTFVRVDSTGAAVTDKSKQAPYTPDGEPLSPITPSLPVDTPVKDGSSPYQTAQTEQRTLATSRTPIAESDTVTTIEINSIGTDGIIAAGDSIILIDRITGQQQTYVVTTDVASSDTTISVTSQAATADFAENSVIVISTKELIGKIPKRYRQEFAAGSGSTLTITENGGTLPDDDYIDVYDGPQYVSTSDREKSGSDIVFTYTPLGVVTVIFWA